MTEPVWTELPPWVEIESYGEVVPGEGPSVFLIDRHTGWSTSGDTLEDAIRDWKHNAPKQASTETSQTIDVQGGVDD